MSNIRVQKKHWDDDDDEDDQPRSTAPVTNVIKERVTFSENAKGQKIRTTVKYRIKEVKTKIPKRVVARRHLQKFGDAKEGEENVTLTDKTIITMDHPDDQMIEEQEDPTIKNTLANFIQKQQERSLNREINDPDLMPESDAYDKSDDKGLSSSFDDKFSSGVPGRYVPPGSRSGGGDARMAGRDDRMGGNLGGGGANQGADDNTIRVSNLTKNVTEDDLRELFGRFGNISRVYLPKMEKTENGKTFKEPKGFAFISFSNKEDAERALDRLQGHGYDHLIIKLEWAKPNKEGSGIPSGPSPAYMSGYGKQLAQDTKEKVLYASNLTGNK